MGIAERTISWLVRMIDRRGALSRPAMCGLVALVVLFAIGVSVAAPTPAAAAPTTTLFVDHAGANNDICSSAQPCDTIAHAVTVASQPPANGGNVVIQVAASR